MAFTLENTAAIEAHLSTHAYLSGGALPNAKDSEIFLALKEAPKVDQTPNFYFWFAALSQFNVEVIKSWAAAPAGGCPNEKKADCKKECKKECNKEKKAEEKPAAAKKNDEDFDLFGDEAPVEKKEAPKKEVAKAKKAVIAKSIVVFNVKVFEQEQDLNELAKRIMTIELDGLVWKKDFEVKPIAYGMNMLEMGCIVEDDKVGTDDIFEKISAWEEEVQSVDIVTFQKL